MNSYKSLMLVGTKQIANALNISLASVSEMIGKLGRDSLLEYDAYKGSEHEEKEAGIENLRTELNWNQDFCKRILNSLIKDENVVYMDNIVKLTNKGRAESEQKYEALFSG